MLHACIVARVDWDAPPAGEDWTPGPLPLPIADSGAVTDRERRSTYFEARASRTLYGSAGSERPRRHHLVPPRPVPLEAPLRIVALEHLRATEFGVGSLMVVHVEATDAADPATTAAAWTSTVRWKRDPDRRARVERAVSHLSGIATSLAPVAEEPFHIAFVPDGTAPADAELSREGHPPPEQWRLVLATGAGGGEAPMTPEQARSFGERIELSADWDALVLRNGAAFVGRPGRPTGFLTGPAPVHVRTVYLDTFLLGILQRLAAERIVGELSALDHPATAPRTVERLSDDLARFRNALWWQHLARHGIGTDLLLAYQRQHRLAEVVEQVRAELHDHGHQTALRSGRVLNDLATLLAIAATLGAAADVYLLLSGDRAPPFPTAVSVGAIAFVAWLISTLVGHNRSPIGMVRERLRARRDER